MGAVAQDNKVACCHSIARCEPDNPSVTHTLKSCNLLACARETAQLYLGVQHGSKDLRLCLLSTNTARTRKGRVGEKKHKTSITQPVLINHILKICSDMKE